MKKSFIILLVLLTQYSFGQYLTQSADGKSSIPLPLNGVGMDIDISKAAVTLGVNNYEQVYKGNRKWMFGLNLSAKNAEGFSKLFSAGGIVPAGNMQGFIGFSLSNNKQLNREFDSSYFYKQVMSQEESMSLLFDTLKLKTWAAVESSISKITDEAIKAGVTEELRQRIEAVSQLKDLDALIANYRVPATDVCAFQLDIRQKYSSLREEYAEAFDHLVESGDASIDNAWNQFLEQAPPPQRYTFFLIGGMSGRNFTRYIGLNATELPESFQDTLFKGGNLGLGVNVQIRNFWIGATYSYISGDNFSSLSSREFNLRTTETAGTQALINKKKITAYTGKYARVETNELNLDLVGDFKITDSSRVIANIYYRSSLASRNIDYLKNYTNIGVGAYFTGLKGKFLGGLYVELPDINNNYEKARPLAEREIQPPFKKLTFGIVTKFDISSIFDFTSRAVRE